MLNYYNWLSEIRASAIAQDADFKEEDHPRNDKGGTGGGRFRTSGKTIEKEDQEDKMGVNEGRSGDYDFWQEYEWNDEAIGEAKRVFGVERWQDAPTDKFKELYALLSRYYSLIWDKKDEKFKHKYSDWKESRQKAIQLYPDALRGRI